MRNLASSKTTLLSLLRRGVFWAALPAVFVYGVGVGANQWPTLLTLTASADALAVEPTSNPPAENLPAGKTPAERKSQSVTYDLATHRQSYFKLDGQGALELKNKLPFRSENVYRFQRTIHPHKTAIVVMDPWVDMASDRLNAYYGKIAETRITPLVRLALKRGHPIIVLTNDPEKVDYNTGIHPELAALAAQGKASILYHHDFDDDAFAGHLRARGVDSLIYTGFASNMCVIGRQMGMIPMIHHGFRLYFVPQASAAVEFPDTWENQAIHRSTTKIISQWIAEIIEYDDFMRGELKHE